MFRPDIFNEPKQRCGINFCIHKEQTEANLHILMTAFLYETDLPQ